MMNDVLLYLAHDEPLLIISILFRYFIKQLAQRLGMWAIE